MPSPCSACGGRCGLESADCIYAGTGPALVGVLPVKPIGAMQAPAHACENQMQPNIDKPQGTAPGN